MNRAIVAAVLVLALPALALAEEQTEFWGAYVESEDQSYGLAWSFPDILSAVGAALAECQDRAAAPCESIWVFSTAMPEEVAGTETTGDAGSLRWVSARCILVTEDVWHFADGTVGGRDVVRRFFDSDDEARDAYEHREPSELTIGADLLQIQCNHR